MNETKYIPNIPQVPKFDRKASPQLSPDKQVDTQQLMAENQLEVIETTRQEIRSREKQATEAVAQLTESLQKAEKVQARSALLVWVHESFAKSGTFNILQFKSGTYVTSEVRQQKIAPIQTELAKAKAELRHIQENKQIWLTELDNREQYFGNQANKERSDAFKRNNAANEGFAPDSQIKNLGLKTSEAARANLKDLGIQNPSHALRQAAARAAEARLLESAVNSGDNDTLKKEIREKYSTNSEVRNETKGELADRKAFEFLSHESIQIKRRTFDSGLQKWASYGRENTKVEQKWQEAQAQLLVCAKLKEQAINMTEDSREIFPVAVLDHFEEVGGALMEGVVSNIKDNKTDGLMSELLRRSTDLQQKVKGEHSGRVNYGFIDALSPQFVGAVALDALFTKHNIPEGDQRVACTLAFIAGFSASYEGYSAKKAISDWMTGVMPIDPPLNVKKRDEGVGISPIVTRQYERAENPTGEPRSLGLFWRTQLSHDYRFGRAQSSVLTQHSSLATSDQREADYVEFTAVEKSNWALHQATKDACDAARSVAKTVNDTLFIETTKRSLNNAYVDASVNIEEPQLENYR